jgi:hypothetical protein
MLKAQGQTGSETEDEAIGHEEASIAPRGTTIEPLSRGPNSKKKQPRTHVFVVLSQYLIRRALINQCSHRDERDRR